MTTIRYAYRHTATEATTGYFSCVPEPAPELEDGLRMLAASPFDDFLRRHVIARLGAMGALKAARVLRSVLQNAPDGHLTAITALIRELALINPAFAADDSLFAMADDLEASSANAGSSLILLRWQKLPDREAHRQWARIFAANRNEHRALEEPGTIGLAPLDFSPDNLPGNSAAFVAPFTVGLADLYPEYAARFGGEAPHTRPPSAETAALAEERLTALGIIAGQEMRHTASLSPVALLRPWNMRYFVRHARHDFTLAGQATTYGRGLNLADARASCLMEMVERASAYLSIDNGQIPGLAAFDRLRHGSLSSLTADGLQALDPNDYPLEAPYRDEPIFWLPGARPDGGQVFIPVQMVSLFCNLDEPAFFDSPGSTGIASGCSIEEAKLAALLEIAERDAEATTPFNKAGCFTLDVDDDPVLARLLADYHARGINVQFQDLTGPLGIPVYKCFVMGVKGRIAAGYGAGLSARRAIVSALTETPFPYPDGGPSGPLLRNLPVKTLAGLPDYSLPTPAASLNMLETLLTKNARPPAYANLTRTDIGCSVVRAFAPGMELTADGGEFSRVPYRLFGNYLAPRQKKR